MRIKHPNISKNIIGFLVVTLLIGQLSFYGVRFPARQAEQGHWVAHTFQVMTQLNEIEKDVAEAEASHYAYLLSGDAADITAYVGSASGIADDVTTLQSLTSDNAVQQQRIPALREATQAKLRLWQQAIDLRRENETALAGTVAIEGWPITRDIRARLHEMRVEEDRLLGIRQDVWQRAFDHTREAFLLGMGVLYILLLLVYLLAVQEVLRRKRLVDVEKRESASQRLEAERMAAIVAVQQEISASSQNLGQAMQVITERTQALTGAIGSIVEMLEGDEIVYRAASGTAAPYVGMRLNPGTSLSGLCLREGQVLICVDALKDKRVDKEACRKVGLRSMVVVPLRHHEVPIGVLKVLSDRPDFFGRHHIATLELMAGSLSAALSDAEAMEALRRAEALLQEQLSIVSNQNRQMASQQKKLEELATTDGLTGLKNHRVLQELLPTEFVRSRRYHAPLSVMMVDVDHFKAYNDRYGHPAGDEVLKRVARILESGARGTDVVFRYGGEEFAVVMPGTDRTGALITAERMRKAVAEGEWTKRAITVSIGIASLGPELSDATALLQAADEALYHSKHHGRNCVTHASDRVETA